jgi:hypothetical protein
MESIRDDMKPRSLAYSIANPWSDFAGTQRMLREADVIVTTAASASHAYLEKANIDYLIVDEASQVDPSLLMIVDGTHCFDSYFNRREIYYSSRRP